MRTIDQILKGTNYSTLQMEEFWSQCFLDYLFFAEHVLGFQIADYHREWYELAEKYPRLCIIAFRGSGKTHFFAGYYLWKSIFQAPRQTLIISNRGDQAKEVLKIIKTMITSNEILKQFVPEDRESTWRATEIELVNGSVFYCKPYNENVRMWHPDDVLCDEMGEYEDKSIFWTAVLGTIQLKLGRVIGIGTRKSESDLLSELKENDEYYCAEYPAEKDRKPLWPQKYTMLNYDTKTQKSLIKIKREIGNLAYNQEYMLIPISSANSLFPMEYLSPCLAEEGFLPFGRKNGRYYIGYDIARAPKGDYTVMTVLEITSKGKKLVKGLRFRGTFEEQLKKFRKLYEDFRPTKCLIDGTGIGDQQARDIEREFAGIEIIKITYDSKLNMFTDLRREFENLNISLPNSKDGAYAFTQQLIKELNEITLKMDLRPGQTTRPKFHSGKYDDCATSLALANRASQNIYGKISFRGLK
ncbi:MAG: phage terminase large subunit family protein [Candidatus Helarchaeota archaeon]